MSTYLVTGANRGIGLELARRLEARGERVIATARQPGQASALAALGVRVEALDVADGDSVRDLVRRLGEEPIDVLINNAGIGVGRAALGALDYGELRRSFEVNALGPLRLSEALLGHLRRGRRRLVAHITSKMGSIADNGSGGSYAYRASKCALNMLNKSLAVDLAPEGFTCVVLHPGWVRTDMGGPAAPLDVGESVQGLLAVLEGLTPERSGEFLDLTGARIPW